MERRRNGRGIGYKKSFQREHTYCLYIMDILCLGVKESAYFFNKDEHEFAEFWEVFDSQFEVMEISYTLAHNIIYAGWEFAEGIGFAPHKDFTRVTQYFLEEDSDKIELLEIECGRDGKPLYVQGPYDSPARAKEIMNQLNKSKGQNGFDFELDTDSERDDGDFDNYEEDVEEVYDCDEDFDKMSFEERVELFHQLTDSDFLFEQGKRQERLYALTNTLCNEIIPYEALEIFEINWKVETEMLISQKRTPPQCSDLVEMQ